MDEFWFGSRWGPARLALLAFACALTSCQSYEESPLEPALHREAWHARTLEDGSLESFLERMQADLGEQATEFDPADGLSLEEGQLVALVFNPGLRLARLRVGSVSATAEFASLWPDPQFQIDFLKITDSVPDPWVITPGLAFTIPISGRLGVEQDRADAALRAAERQVLEAEWNVWYQVRVAWVAWSAARLRVEETERLVSALDGLVRTADLLAESGEFQRIEATLFTVEQEQRRNQLRRLRGDVAEAEQRLRSLLGLSPAAPATFVPALTSVPEPSTDEASAIGERNPTLTRLQEEYDVAEQTLRREIKKQIPDLTLGPLFETDQGQSRVGFLGAIPIPLWNRNQQAIAEARAQREVARATFETQYELTVGRWAAVTARANALSEQRADMEEVLVPLVDRQLSDTMRLMQLGELTGTSLVVLESLTRAYQTKLQLIESRSAEAQARAEIEFLTGPIDRSPEAKEETP